ncbi:hypothetical protein V8E51_007736 [Hyaloscypha variabilis]
MEYCVLGTPSTTSTFHQNAFSSDKPQSILLITKGLISEVVIPSNNGNLQTRFSRTQPRAKWLDDHDQDHDLSFTMPTRKRSHKSGFSVDIWATSRPMLSQRDRRLVAEEACVGSVVWLRQRFYNEEDIPCIREGHCTNYKLGEDGYMHPVVILKMWQRSGSTLPGDLMLAVSELTSFEDTPIDSYTNYKDKYIKFKEAIPILHEGESRWSDPEQLSLESGWLQKKSWIRLQHVLLIHVSCLWKYDWHVGGHGYDQRLDENSYLRLMSLFGIFGDKYESSTSVVHNASSRLQQLAREEGLKYYQDYPLHADFPEQATYNQDYGLENENLHIKLAEPLSHPAGIESDGQKYQATSSYSVSRDDSHYNSNTISEATSQPQDGWEAHSITSRSLPFNSTGMGSISGYPEPIFGSGSGSLLTNLQPQPHPQRHTPNSLANNSIGPQTHHTIHNNFQFFGSTDFFNGAMTSNYGMIPGQAIQPWYRNIGQQLDQGPDHLHSRNPRQNLNPWNYQHVQQLAGQNTSHAVQQPAFQQVPHHSQAPLYHSNHTKERENPFLRPFLELHSRNNSMPTISNDQTPAPETQFRYDQSQQFSSRIPAAPQLATRSVSNPPPNGFLNVPDSTNSTVHTSPARQHVSPSRRTAPYLEPHDWSCREHWDRLTNGNEHGYGT